MLESLLFEEIVVNKEKGIKLKVPVWSGEFLREIYLSEVDFTNDIEKPISGLGKKK